MSGGLRGRAASSAVERVAMELRQIESEDAAGCSGNTYTLTAQETWKRAGEVLRAGYRRDARRILRVARGVRVLDALDLDEEDP